MDMEKDNIEKDVDIDIRDEKHYMIVTASRLVYLHARLELFSIGTALRLVTETGRFELYPEPKHAHHHSGHDEVQFQASTKA